MLDVQDLVTYHGHILALRRASLKVAPGELVAIIGANGAGKSTLMGTLAGIYTPSRGQIFMDGKDVTGFNAEKMVGHGITLVPERRQLFDTLTVIDNLKLGAYHRYRREKSNLRRDIEEVLELFPALQGKEHELAGNLSGGLQQMVAIGRGVMAKPKLLMLDEPSVGLAPMVLAEIMELLLRLKEKGTTILLVEQNARAALRVADRAYVLDRGRCVLSGSANELLSDQRVQVAYLGRATKHALAT
ncbi:MAG: ABC transporter ATP-binding protein [Candidatus Saccharibacteria bacterium]